MVYLYLQSSSKSSTFPPGGNVNKRRRRIGRKKKKRRKVVKTIAFTEGKEKKKDVIMSLFSFSFLYLGKEGE